MLLGYALLLKCICYVLGEPFPADVPFLWLVCLSMEMNIVTILPGKFNKQNSFPQASASLCPSWPFIKPLRMRAQLIIFPSLQSAAAREGYLWLWTEHTGTRLHTVLSCLKSQSVSSGNQDPPGLWALSVVKCNAVSSLRNEPSTVKVWPTNYKGRQNKQWPKEKNECV